MKQTLTSPPAENSTGNQEAVRMLWPGKSPDRKRFRLFSNSFLFTLLAFLSVSISSWAQTSAQIGTGTDVPANTLYGPLYRFSTTSSTSGARVNMVWTAAEMAAAGILPGSTITAVQ